MNNIKSSILFSSKENFKKLMIQENITYKALNRHLLSFYGKDETKFYEISYWLKEDFSDFFNINFKNLYQKSLNHDKQGILKLIKFGFNIKGSSLLYLLLHKKVKNNEIGYNFNNTHREFIKQIINIYKENKISNKEICKEIEEFVRTSGYNYDYNYIRDLYKDNNPEKTCNELDVFWFRSRYYLMWDASDTVGSNSVYSLLEQKIKEMIFVYLEENNSDKNLKDLAESNPNFKNLLLNVQNIISLKSKIEENLDKNKSLNSHIKKL